MRLSDWLESSCCSRRNCLPVFVCLFWLFVMQYEVAGGCVQIIRGPRPKAATWPKRGDIPHPIYQVHVLPFADRISSAGSFIEQTKTHTKKERRSTEQRPNWPKQRPHLVLERRALRKGGSPFHALLQDNPCQFCLGRLAWFRTMGQWEREKFKSLITERIRLSDLLGRRSRWLRDVVLCTLSSPTGLARPTIHDLPPRTAVRQQLFCVLLTKVQSQRPWEGRVLQFGG